ncbi:hypothetical protein [Natronorarus salvus]|uniref:hypothetical protein n=1 Tax=Natronorarus salvus TaxID=3117733 RepID=UPI002F268033
MPFWTMVAVAFGGLITIVTTVVTEKWKEKQESGKVENALANEMEILGPVLEEILLALFLHEYPDRKSELLEWSEFESGIDQEKINMIAYMSKIPHRTQKIGNKSSFETPVFDNTADKLILLDEHIATNVIQFYAAIIALEEHVPDPSDDEYKLAYLDAFQALEWRYRALTEMGRDVQKTDHKYMTNVMGYRLDDEEKEREMDLDAEEFDSS